MANFINENHKKWEAMQIYEGLNRSYEEGQEILKALNDDIKIKRGAIKELMALRNEYYFDLTTYNSEFINSAFDGPIAIQIQNNLIAIMEIKNKQKNIIAESNIANNISQQEEYLIKNLIDANFDFDLTLSKLRKILNQKKSLDSIDKSYINNLFERTIDVIKRDSKVYMSDVVIVKNYNFSWFIVRAGLIGFLLTLAATIFCAKCSLSNAQYFYKLLSELNFTRSK